MTAALLLDEMISARVASQVRDGGVDATAISETPHLRGATDAEVLEIGAGAGRVLITSNIKDFAALSSRCDAAGRTHAGILFISAKAYPSDRSFIGRVTAALLERIRSDRWPHPGGIDFL